MPLCSFNGVSPNDLIALFVSASTIIGGGGKLEFTLIGDTINVAARVEQLTKTTGDAILVTQQTVDALSARIPELADRGAHALKGKSAPVRIFGLDPRTTASC